jgi:uncharacterized protein involved in response to NO
MDSEENWPVSTQSHPAARAATSPTPPFVWAATLLALLAGFGLGGALFVHRPGIWWVAAAQGHGHAQLFGWAGLLAVGVSLHFLPRLRGAPLAAPRLVPWVLGLYAGGIALRVVVQPLAAYVPGVLPLLPLSGLLELAGAALAVGMLVATARGGQRLEGRTGFIQVLPLLAVAFLSFCASQILNAVGLAAAAGTGIPLVPAPWHLLAVHLGLTGFLVVLSLAVSARTFPLYLRVRSVDRGALWAVLAVLGAGFVLRSVATWGTPPEVDALGRLLEGWALLAAAWLLDAPLLRTRAATLAETETRARQQGVAPRPPVPRASELVAADGLLRTAYAWLVVAAALLVIGGVAALLGQSGPPVDAERHALGAGFVTLLILGMGIHLLPGFMGRRIASVRLAWASFWLGNAAALLRVVPTLVPWLLALGGVTAPLPPLARDVLNGLLALSGLLGMEAVACFGWNLWRTLR